MLAANKVVVVVVVAHAASGKIGQLDMGVGPPLDLRQGTQENVPKDVGGHASRLEGDRGQPAFLR